MKTQFLNIDRDPIPEFDTLEEIAEFWDDHSTTDYHDLTYEVSFQVSLHSSTEQAHTHAPNKKNRRNSARNPRKSAS